MNKQLEQARNLIKTVRHAAYATTNADGSPHNSPLKLIYNDALTKLYIGSHSESLHVKNLLRTGQAYVVLYDSFKRDQGGIYITGANAKECKGDDLVKALKVHNTFREKDGARHLKIEYYEQAKPAQRMYSIDVSRIEVYSFNRDANGHIESEARLEIKPEELL